MPRTTLTGAEPNYQAIQALPFRKCGRSGCINRGIFGLKICVPATGYRLFSHTPISSYLDVVVCDSHIEDIRAEEFLTESLINYMTAAAKKANKVMPDFRRAYIDGIPVNEREWVKWQASVVSFRTGAAAETSSSPPADS